MPTAIRTRGTPSARFLELSGQPINRRVLTSVPEKKGGRRRIRRDGFDRNVAYEFFDRDLGLGLRIGELFAVTGSGQCSGKDWGSTERFSSDSGAIVRWWENAPASGGNRFGIRPQLGFVYDFDGTYVTPATRENLSSQNDWGSISKPTYERWHRRCGSSVGWTICETMTHWNGGKSVPEGWRP